MTLRSYLILMSIGTLLCWVAWFFIVSNISPAEAGLQGLLFFYFSLFLAIVGTFSVIGFAVRKMIIKDDEVIFRHVRHTFRQSIFIALLLIIILILLSQNLLYWWNAIILFIFFMFVEGILFSSRRHSNN